MNQKGLIPIIVLLLMVFIGGVIIFKYQNIKNSAVNQILPQTTSVSPTPIAQEDRVNRIQEAKQSPCDPQIDICFENNNININIKQGYQESTDHWIGESFKLIGKGGSGYTLTLSSDFPQTITLNRPKSSFDNETSITIYPQVQKNVTSAGIYTGTLVLNTPNSSQPKVAKLTINYINWDKSFIHLDPANLDFSYNLNTKKYTFPLIAESHFAPKFYYFGSHNIELRTIRENSTTHGYDAKFSTELRNGIVANGGFDPTRTQVNDIRRLNLQMTSDVDQFPPGIYTGYIQFIDLDNKNAEVLRVPYKITVTTD